MTEWYEKTVEYAFVRQFCSAAAMPLAGNAEKAGDALFYENDEFFLIEFKRGYDIPDEIEQEKEKFDSFDNFTKKVNKEEKLYNAWYAHYLVCGDYNEGYMQFSLWYACYGNTLQKHSDIEKNQPKDKKEFNQLYNEFTKLTPIKGLGNGMSKEELKTYLDILLKAKKQTSSTLIDYGNTLIVNSDGNAISLQDAAKHLDLDLKFNPGKNTPKVN